MRTCIFLMVTLGLLSGCQYFDKRYASTGAESKAEAYKRWGHSRTEILCGVAEQYIKTGQLDEAFSKLKEAISLEETNPQAHILLGRVYIEKTQYLKAEGELAHAQQLDPNAVEAVYLMGVAKEKDGKLDEALASYQRAESMDPGNLSAVKAAAEVYVAMGQVGQAQKYLDGFMQNAGGDVGMYELAGRLAMMNKDPAKAVRYFQQASDGDPKNVRYYEALATAKFSACQYPETLAVLLSLGEFKNYKMPAWALRMKGDCFITMARYPDARVAYQAAADLNPESASAWLLVAQAAMLAGDSGRAVQSARRASQLEPSNVDAAMMLGYATLRSGQADVAITALAAANAAHPQDTLIWCLLGRCYAAAGKASDALRCYNAALKVDPANKLALELVATMKATDKPKVN